MSIDTLRELSRAYAAGTIDRESYRRARREMLRKVVAGEQPLLQFRSPEPEAPTLFPYDENDGDTTQEIMPSAALAASRSDPPTGRGQLVGVFIAIAVLVGVGVAAFKYFSASDAPATAQVEPAPAAANVLDDFLAARSWTASSTSALIARWDALPERTRDDLARSDTGNRLSAAVLQQLRAADALRELGEAEDALETEGQLLDLTEHLGIRNARLDAARKQWTEARAALAATPPAATAAAEAEVGTDNAATPSVDEAPDTGETVVPGTDDPLPAEPAALPADAPPAAAASAAPALPKEPLPAPQAAPTATDAPSAAAATAATAKSAARKPAATRSNCRAALSKTRRPYCVDVAADGTKGPQLVVLPGGRFVMGGREANEQPRHEVALAQPFAIGMFEVSAGEFAGFCKAAGAPCPAQPWNNPAYPVVNVTWAQAEAYAAWLSGLLGATYRLPSEAEWEYAARGGSTTEYPLGDELLPTHARYSFKSTLDEPLPANDRSLNRNAFRLYHIIGNVREWVADAWAATYSDAAADGRARPGSNAARAVRGGSYADAADALRTAARRSLDAGAADVHTGFRLVRLLD